MMELKSIKIYLHWLAIILISLNTNLGLSQQQSKLKSSFTEVFTEFPRVEKNLRKWDAPVIADLDQDGFPDMIINDHGLGVSICWNNKGSFAKPYDLIMGDLHGVSVGDFDFDGNLEIVLSRGGGSGSNARNSKVYRVNRQREFVALPDFKEPLALMRGRTVRFFDGDNDGDLDLINFAFPTKEKKGESENYIYENKGSSQLVMASNLPASVRDGQKTLLTDFNGDHVMDIILYGQGNVKIFEGQGDLTYLDKSDSVLPFAIDQITGIIEIDYDNDGDFDLYFTRSKGFEIGETFYNEETLTWGFASRRGPFEFEDLEIGDVLLMENFQSQWPFNDAYYIGESGYEYPFEGETHSGKDIRLVNSNALGFPDVLNEEGGIHIGYIGNDKWKLAVDTWSPTTGTIKGVKSYPEYNHPKGLQDYLLENRNGKYVDISSKANIVLEEHSVAVSTADFDNNGYQDILVIRRGELVFENEPLLFLNQGDSKFELSKNNGLKTFDLGSIGMAVNTLDYNLDGLVDVVIGNERGKWHLLSNEMKVSTDRNYLIVDVGSSPTGKATALDALVTVKSCKEEQIKRVGATAASYSGDLNNFLHFGLSQCDSSIKINIRWSNGENESRVVNLSNQKIRIGKSSLN